MLPMTCPLGIRRPRSNVGKSKWYHHRDGDVAPKGEGLSLRFSTRAARFLQPPMSKYDLTSQQPSQSLRSSRAAKEKGRKPPKRSRGSFPRVTCSSQNRPRRFVRDRHVGITSRPTSKILNVQPKIYAENSPGRIRHHS